MLNCPKLFHIWKQASVLLGSLCVLTINNEYGEIVELWIFPPHRKAMPPILKDTIALSIITVNADGDLIFYFPAVC